MGQEYIGIKGQLTLDDKIYITDQNIYYNNHLEKIFYQL